MYSAQCKRRRLIYRRECLQTLGHFADGSGNLSNIFNEMTLVKSAQTAVWSELFGLMRMMCNQGLMPASSPTLQSTRLVRRAVWDEIRFQLRIPSSKTCKDSESNNPITSFQSNSSAYWGLLFTDSRHGRQARQGSTAQGASSDEDLPALPILRSVCRLTIFLPLLSSRQSKSTQRASG